MDERPILAVDGTGLLVRCSRAASRRVLSASDGTPTGPLLMFINALARKIRKVSPGHVVIAWDGQDACKWRRSLYPAYKAHRALQETPGRQILRAREFCQAAGLHELAVAGFEADDILAAVTRNAAVEMPGYPVVLCSDDNDLEQLLDHQVTLTGLTEDYIVTAADVEELRRIQPLHLPKLRALAGDSSDNIPGVRGIGKVRASRMLHEANMKWPLPESLLPDDESRELVVVWRDIIDLVIPLRPPEWEAGVDHFRLAGPARWDPRFTGNVRHVLERYELSSVVRRLEKGGLW